MLRLSHTARLAAAARLTPLLSRSASSAAAAATVAPALGFQATGVRCGIKKKRTRHTDGIHGNAGWAQHMAQGRALVYDFCLIRSESPCAAAGVFTQNQFCAAPVVVSRAQLSAHPAQVHGVAINAGCANACTGERGMADANEMVSLAAEAGVSNALVMSTGVIGPFLPMDKIRSGFASSVEARAAATTDPAAGWADAALAVMTTDTHPKVLHRRYAIEGKEFTLSGICKGAGMIHPNMATMLAVVATDLSVAPEPLQTALRFAADRSFNSISIDGDTSTNDSLVVLANGQAPAWKQPTASSAAGSSKPSYGINSVQDSAYPEFQRILTEYCIDLAHKIVRDGEGATKFVTVQVTSARSYEEAKIIANSIATSMLVKTALFGQDANWGRILCATGYAGVPIDANKVNLYIRPTSSNQDPTEESPATHSTHTSGAPDALLKGGASSSASSAPLGTLHLVRGGQPFDCDEAHATALFRQRDITLHVDLGLGEQEATVWTCDLSLDYVNINADYRS